jgi:hypothetical protein
MWHVGEERANPLAEHRLRGLVSARAAGGQAECLVATIVCPGVALEQTGFRQSAQ